MTAETPTLLVTSVGGTMAPASILELKRSFKSDLRIVGTCGTAAPAGERVVDAFARVPMGSSEDYIPKLLEVIDAEGVDVVLPWSDEEAIRVAGAIDEFRARGAVPIVSSADCLKLISNKAATYEVLKKAGLAVPEYSVVKSIDDLRHALGAYGYPDRTVIVKSPAGRGGRDLHVLCGQDDPPAWLGSGSRETRHDARTPFELESIMGAEAMVMPRLHDPVYDVDIYAVEGEVRASSVRVRTNPTGIPFEGNKLVLDPRLDEFCARISALLGLDAIHDMDVMSDENGEPRLLEVNPRPSGSLIASMIAGVPILQMAISDALGLSHDYKVERRECEVVVYLNALAVPVTA